MSELPDFETMYLEFQRRTDGTVPLVDEVLESFRERSIAGVAVSGEKFGLDTPVIAKVAMTMHDDSAVLWCTSESGELTLGAFAGSVCADLARALNTDVVADEYVLYSPASVEGEPEFIELDPRRQSIDQPAGFPNEWRVSPSHLGSRGAVFVDGVEPLIASAVARDTDCEISYGVADGHQVIELPAGVVELPTDLPSGPKQRVVVFAQAGEAKFAHLVIGKRKDPLHLTFASLPKFTAAAEFPESSTAFHLLALISNPGLVAGSINMTHPSFPHHVMPRYQYLSDPVNSHSFFGEVAELLSLPDTFSSFADSGFPSLEENLDAADPGFGFNQMRRVSPHEAPEAKRSWFRRF